MHVGRTIFAQLLDYIPRYEFHQCVERYRGNYKVKSFSCWEQFLCLAFAQLTYRESLRDIEACLRAINLYHLGIRSTIARNTLAHANETRDWRIYADFAQILIQRARELYCHDDFGIELNQVVYALDATIIDLCLAVFPWAHFRQSKAAVKLHTLLDVRGSIPVIIRVTPANIHEVNLLDELRFEPGALYLMDRGYWDLTRLFQLHLSGAFFVTRAKSNLVFRRQYSQPVDKTAGIQADQIIVAAGYQAQQHYPASLRRIRYHDAATHKRLIFLSNNLLLPAPVIAQLYQCRWQVELFFKWLKQHLRIKAFYGTSENAVKTQIWIAIAVYVLVAIIKKQLHLSLSLYTILQILSVNLFRKTPILQALSQNQNLPGYQHLAQQLILFD